MLWGCCDGGLGVGCLLMGDAVERGLAAAKTTFWETTGCSSTITYHNSTSYGGHSERRLMFVQVSPMMQESVL